MGNCHYCMNCGRCRGEQPPPIHVRRCLTCAHVNAPGSKRCAVCGASLELQAGTTALAPGKTLRKATSQASPLDRAHLIDTSLEGLH